MYATLEMRKEISSGNQKGKGNPLKMVRNIMNYPINGYKWLETQTVYIRK